MIFTDLPWTRPWRSQIRWPAQGYELVTVDALILI